MLYGCEVWSPLTNQDFIKWDKHQIEPLHAKFCRSMLKVQRKKTNNACRAELGRYPIVIKIQKRALQLYNHLKESDSNTLHNKALTNRELEPEKWKSLTRYILSEHSLAIEKGHHRQTWLPREDRLCSHCTHNQRETELQDSSPAGLTLHTIIALILRNVNAVYLEFIFILSIYMRYCHFCNFYIITFIV